MMLRREEPITVLARRYGVSETTLRRWREDFLQAGEAALSYGPGKLIPLAGLGFASASLHRTSPHRAICMPRIA